MSNAAAARSPLRSTAWAAFGLLLFAAGAAAGCDPVDSDFFPLNEGNVWLYDWSRAVQAPVQPTLASPRLSGPSGPSGPNGWNGATGSTGAAGNPADADLPPPPPPARMWTVTDPPGAVETREKAAVWRAAGSTAIALQHVTAQSCVTYTGEYRPGGTLQVSKINGFLTLTTHTNLVEQVPMQLDLPLLAYPIFRGAKWEDYGSPPVQVKPIAMCRLIGFETVTTPAGTFFDCAHIVRVIDPTLSNLQSNSVQHFWLAPDIGLVKILYEDDRGPAWRAELRAFHLNPLPAAAADKQRAEIDRTLQPDQMVLPGEDAGHEKLTPDEMYRREQSTTHADGFRP
ncbi:MAG: hypothetical protein ACREJ2_05775 [Planctomycetota bacterium]